MKRTAVALFLAFAAFFSASAQRVEDFEDLDAVSKKGFFKTYIKGMFSDFTDFGKPFDYSGGLGVSMRSYAATGATARQDPFFYGVNASFNARVYKLNLPFSLSVSAKNREHAYPNLREMADAFRNDTKNKIASQRQRFVRFGISPRYKWAKTHFGHRTMDFSQFTMSNLVFLGAGAELTPGKIRFSAMGGQLARAEPIDLSLVEPNIPRFERKGWGIKAGYGSATDFVEVVLFQARDLQNSIFLPDTALQISPEANQSLGLVFQKSFAEKFKFKLDAGASALSPNARDAAAKTRFPHPSFGYFEATQTTVFKKAIDADFSFQAKKYTLGAEYRRVDPGFRTLGAYFFNSDIEDISLNLSTSFLQGAVNFRASGGVRRNNLDGSKPNRLTRRAIGNFDASYSKNRLALGANYANNSSDVAYLLNPGDPLLNVLIVAQDAGFLATYTIADTSKKRQHVLSFTANAQLVTDDVLDPSASAFSKMWLGNLAYALGLETGWSLQSRLNFNQNELSTQRIRRFGAGAGATKTFLKGKLSTGLDFNFFYTLTQNFGSNGNFSSGLNSSWNISDAHSLSMNWIFLQTKNASATATNRFGEVVGQVGYQYRFSKKPNAKKAEKSPPEGEKK